MVKIENFFLSYGNGKPVLKGIDLVLMTVHLVIQLPG